MENKREFTCINCPIGCTVMVTLNSEGEIADISGNRCKRGENYVRKELTNPRRVVTSTLRLKDSRYASVSVKTRDDVPKGAIFEVMDVIRKSVISPPIHVGEVLIENIAQTGVDLVATEDRLE